MDVQKPIRMLDGIAKMSHDVEWKLRVEGLKGQIEHDWPSMTEAEQEETYTKTCELFRDASAKCLTLLSKKT